MCASVLQRHRKRWKKSVKELHFMPALIKFLNAPHTTSWHQHCSQQGQFSVCPPLPAMLCFMLTSPLQVHGFAQFFSTLFSPTVSFHHFPSLLNTVCPFSPFVTP